MALTTIENPDKYVYIHRPVIYRFSSDSQILNISIGDLNYQVKSNDTGIFRFDASEQFRSFYEFDFNSVVPTNQTIIYDNQLSREVTITFSDADSNISFTHILFHGSRSGSLGNANQLALHVGNKLPVYDLQELTIYSNEAKTIRGVALREGVNRIILNSLDQINTIGNAFGIQLQKFDVTGLDLRYWSSAAGWINLKASCNYRKTLNLNPLPPIITDDRFKTRGVQASEYFELLVTYDHYNYELVKDLLLSTAVFIKFESDYVKCQILDSEFSLNQDNYGTLVLNVNTKPLYTVNA